jgi:hypothetical protein
VDVEACKLEDADADLGSTGDQTPYIGWPVYLSIDGVRQEPVQYTAEPDGCYTWENLGPGHSYDVEEDVLDNWFNLTPTSYDFGPAESGQSYSFEFVNSEYATKSGMKWHDMDGNGSKGTEEPVLPGWTIELWDVSGTPTPADSTTTDVNGVYTFTQVVPGVEYVVCEVLEEGGWFQTAPEPGDGVVECATYGLDEGYGMYGYLINLTSGEEDLDNDFGNKKELGCTLTQGYWKNHDYDSNHFDLTWWEDYTIVVDDPNNGVVTTFSGNLQGGQEVFLNNSLGYSWSKVLDTPPSGGNAYYILAHQYIAAYLNSIKLDGHPADTSLITEELSHAVWLLYTYSDNIIPDGATDSGLSANDRAYAIEIAETLDLFNNGDDTLGGPPHCDY